MDGTDNRNEIRQFLAPRQEPVNLARFGELSMRSEEFRVRWAAHNVRYHHTGLKDIHHPVVGDLHLAFEAMDLPADPGLSLVVYSAEPGSAAEEALGLLASWIATSDAEAGAVAANAAP